MSFQLSMTGDDWLSASDNCRQAKAEAARKKAGAVCARKLFAAADALSEYSMACLECNDESSPRRADDGRTLLAYNIREFAGWLSAVYDKP